MPLHAKRIRERQCDGRAVFGCDVHSLAGELRALGQVPDVAFEQYGLRSSQRCRRYIADAQLGTGTEVGLHRALAVTADQHMAARRRRAVRTRLQPDVDAQRAHVVIKNPAKLIGFNPADVRCKAAQVGKTGDRIGD